MDPLHIKENKTKYLNIIVSKDIETVPINQLAYQPTKYIHVPYILPIPTNIF
jgi:hypothetical protein